MKVTQHLRYSQSHNKLSTRNSVISNKELNNIPNIKKDINNNLGISKRTKKIYKINKILPRK